MKRLFCYLLLIGPLFGSSAAYSQSSGTCATCSSSREEVADLSAAVSSAFGSRLALGPFRDVTIALREYHADLAENKCTPAGLPGRLQATASVRANPQRLCTIIRIYDIAAPIISEIANIVPPLPTIPLPAACTQPTPTPAPVPPATGPPHKLKFLTGAKPTPRHKLISAAKFTIKGAPLQYAVVPKTLSMWGNSVDGDCVSAEEAFAKAMYSVANGQTELFIPENTLVSWAAKHHYLNGAELTTVMTTMATQGLVTGGTTWCDGGYQAVDYTNTQQLDSAIFVGPVKIGIAAAQLQSSGAGNGNGWTLIGAQPDTNEDHCVSLCGYGPLSWLATQVNATLPAGTDGTKPGYLMFTWSSIGVVDQVTVNNIVGEAWVRNPTTTVGGSPTPAPTPAPTPTRRFSRLLKDVDVLVGKYQTGSESDKAQVLSLLDKVESTTASAKHTLGIAP